MPTKDRQPLTDEAGEVRELTAEDLKDFRPASEVLPPSLVEGLAALKRRARGPQKTPVKARVTLRLSAEVAQAFRATGKGWQSRIDAALKEWLSRRAGA